MPIDTKIIHCNNISQAFNQRRINLTKQYAEDKDSQQTEQSTNTISTEINTSQNITTINLEKHYTFEELILESSKEKTQDYTVKNYDIFDPQFSWKDIFIR